MLYQSTISAFRKVMLTFEFPVPQSAGEAFAVKRYKKKFARPDKTLAKVRRESCWDQWIGTDENLRLPGLLPPRWYQARLAFQKALGTFRLADTVFTTGSEFVSTGGAGSIESKLLRSTWTCTPDCFELWAETAYDHKALKRATRVRYLQSVAEDVASTFVGPDRNVSDFKRRLRWNLKVRDRYLWSVTRGSAAKVFRLKLARVTMLAQGNRFSTVFKSNDEDRPVCMEPLCNMLVQRRIGLGLREVIKTHFGIDLRVAQATHRARLESQFLKIATIDLKGASDSILLELVKFVSPGYFFGLIERARSPFTLGLDDQYYQINKVSSMGNGFTFELMTLMLLCVCRTLDPEASVYGDDIIIDWTKAYQLQHDLVSVGFVVNTEKSFIHGDFRESCGGNYHYYEGYLESYDFRWPDNIGDCVVLFNKCVALSSYPGFERLSKLLKRAIPPALRGSTCSYNGARFAQDLPELGRFFMSGFEGKWRRSPKGLHLGRYASFTGLVWKPFEVSKMTRNLGSRDHWAKYEMYLHSGSAVPDVYTGKGEWVAKTFYECDGRVFLSDLRERPLGGSF